MVIRMQFIMRSKIMLLWKRLKRFSQTMKINIVKKQSIKVRVKVTELNSKIVKRVVEIRRRREWNHRDNREIHKVY
jgi:hypothetical protein